MQELQIGAGGDGLAEHSMATIQAMCARANGGHEDHPANFLTLLRSAGNKNLPHAMYFLGCFSESGKSILSGAQFHH